jgi:hypothetical protein
MDGPRQGGIGKSTGDGGMTKNPLTWLPFTKDGRATLIYIFFALSVPALCGMLVYVLYTIRWFDAPALDRLERFYQIGMRITLAMLLGMLAYAAFVSFRAFKAGKDGVEMNSKDEDSDVVRSGDSVEVTKQ